MNKQMSFSDLTDELAQVRTHKKEFLAQIEQLIPWGEWETMADYETPMRERMETFIRGVLPQRKPVKALDVGCGAAS